MRVLKLGGDGMLGHRLTLEQSRSHNVVCTLRRELADYAQFGIFTAQNRLTGIDARESDRLLQAIDTARPDVAVNDIGIVKQQLGGALHATPASQQATRPVSLPGRGAPAHVILG